MKTRKIMAEFKINEISGVDRPAQEGARALLMKRAEPEVGKDYCEPPMITLVTSAEDGHTHLLWVELGRRGGSTSYGQAEGEEGHGHDHPWTLDPTTGRVVVHENHGHTHDVDAAQVVETLLAAMKSKDTPEEDTGMANDDRVAALEAEKADLTKRLERAEKLSTLSDNERALLVVLESDAQRDEFLALSPDARKAQVAAAAVKSAESNPVVYKSADGTEYRGTDDPRLIQLAKRDDLRERELLKAQEAVETAAYTKRAGDELPNLPGTVEVRARILKAVDQIEDPEIRKSALEALVAGSNAMKGAFQRQGTTDSGGAADGSPEDQLDALAKARATTDKIDFAKAYSAVLDTPEGQALYQQIEIRG